MQSCSIKWIELSIFVSRLFYGQDCHEFALVCVKLGSKSRLQRTSKSSVQSLIYSCQLRTTAERVIETERSINGKTARTKGFSVRPGCQGFHWKRKLNYISLFYCTTFYCIAISLYAVYGVWMPSACWKADRQSINWIHHMIIRGNRSRVHNDQLQCIGF